MNFRDVKRRVDKSRRDTSDRTDRLNRRLTKTMPVSKRKLLLGPIALSVAIVLLLNCVGTASSAIRGVPGSRQALYDNKGDTWTCLDGSKTLHYSAINDDYCDCADGSDEPGTSACPNGRFWCANVGHTPAYIKSSRVNDGVCDPECCDGSDETSGLATCPNVCREAGAKHREQQRQLTRILEEGTKVKRELIKFGQEKKAEWVAEKQKLEGEIEGLKVKVEELKALRDKAQSTEAAAREAAKGTTATSAASGCPKCPRCPRGSSVSSTDATTTATLRAHLATVQEHLDTLLAILHDLKRDHNQNYHDLAVKSAISGYDELTLLWDGQKDDITKDVEELDDSSIIDDYDADDIAELEAEADESTLIESEDLKKASKGKSPSQPASGFLGKLSAYIPAFVKNTVVKATGKVWGEEKDELTHAQEALNGPESELDDKENLLRDLDDKLNKNYGLNQEWAQLENQCFEKSEGEYTYSLCILGQTTQKSNRDSGSTDLGRFKKFMGNDDPNSEEHYTKHLYDQGTRCWNGPERSVKATFECGATTELLTVTEPEKCEYAFRLRSPAACSLGKVKDVAGKEDKKPKHEEL